MGLFDSSIGAFLIATIFAIYLTGVTTTQAFSYYTTFPNDRKLYVWLVSILLFIDLFHTAICCYTIYYWTVTIYGQAALLARVPWTFAIDPAITGIAASMVQIFYAYRVYLVSGRKPLLPILIVCLSAVQCGFSIGGTAMIFVLNYEVARFHEWTYGVTTWLISSAVTDILITGSLVYYLRRATQDGEHIRTNSIVQTILRNTIETNGLTCIVAIADAALFLASDQSWHVIANLSLVKLYYNSLLVSLNSREKLAARANQSGQMSNDTGYTQKTYGTGLKSFGGTNNSNIVAPIVVTMQETVVDADYSEKDDHPFSRTVANSNNVDRRPIDVELNDLNRAQVHQERW